MKGEGRAERLGRVLETLVSLHEKAVIMTTWRLNATKMRASALAVWAVDQGNRKAYEVAQRPTPTNPHGWTNSRFSLFPESFFLYQASWSTLLAPHILAPHMRCAGTVDLPSENRLVGPAVRVGSTNPHNQLGWPVDQSRRFHAQSWSGSITFWIQKPPGHI